MALLRSGTQEAVFTPDPATGGGSLTMPLDLPPGPGDRAPALALRYTTGAANGPFGAGFALPLPHVRSVAGHPKSGTEDRLVRQDDGVVLTTRSGLRHFFGRGDGWYLDRTEDAFGNTTAFGWAHHSGQAYLASVAYGPYEVDFGYEPRPDVLRWGRGGTLVTTELRCARIDLRVPGDARPLVRRWSLGYGTDDVTGASLLTSVALTGFDAHGAEAAAPVLRLAYARTEPPPSRRVQLAAKACSGGSVLLLDDGAVPYYSLAELPRTGRLSEIDNGLGLRTSIEYAVVETVTVVRRVTAQTGVTEFEYHDGFSRVVQDEVGDEHAPTLRTVRWFDDGVLRRAETYGLDGSPEADRPYRRVEHTRRPQWTRTVTTEFERRETPVSVTTTETAFDAAGNPTREVETTERSGHEPEVRETRTTYATDPDHRFAALPARVRTVDGAGKVLSDTLFRYDERPDGSAGAHGLLTAREELVLTDALAADVYGAHLPDFRHHGYHRRPGEDGWWATTFHGRLDTVTGLRTTTTGPLGHTHEVRYSADRCFAEVATDPLGNVTVTRHDVRTGRVCEVTDPAGAVTTVTHDPLGRPETVVRPGDTADLPTVRHHYGPARVTTEQRAVSGESEVLVTTELRDGAGRLLERRHAELLGDVVEEQYEYCARGFVSLVRQAFRAGGPRPAPTEFHYDALGRPLAATATDPAPSGTWDLLGRELREVGGVVHVRDAAGNPVESRTPGGHTVFRVHDALDRVVAILVDDPGGMPVTTFTYHDGGLPVPIGAGPHSCGRLVRVADESGVTLFGYDALGRPAEKRWRPAHVAVEYRLDVVRRADGQLSEVVYPDAGDGRLTVRHQYDEVGRLVSVPGYVEAVHYDVRGHRTAVRYANGVVEHFAPGHGIIGPRGLRREISPGRVPERRSGSEIRDAFGRLRGVHGDDGVNALYGYDHTGRRVRTLVTEGPSIHEVLTPDELYAIEDGELVVVVAGSVRQYADGRRRYLHFDDAGEVALVTDEQGELVTSP
ncbi:RHS repeat domain-containing protein [Amycolatopsis nalaikhensis]|uniref:SpvB/TcaC N-terminal domain-containing protein n=1 Tax=Amycolatopsis nalaikhensis TaxID=715472 RepID=A0ABY8XX58_9PSEU|nr:SpvB/TcaC N-terminal domain-containing protein [Amycolatopsis sp. 2-2]WIV60290.1 SpvB/TcaC N-terminal domain-containing protein [Amycolatopsis sp. 2-2]